MMHLITRMMLMHKVSIVSYGDWDNPADICLECEDCGEVVLDAEI